MGTGILEFLQKRGYLNFSKKSLHIPIRYAILFAFIWK
jgi:hypothetical protein